VHARGARHGRGPRGREHRRRQVAFETTDLRAKLARHHADVDSAFLGWNRIWLDPAFRAWNIEEYLPRIACPVLAIQGEDERIRDHGTDAPHRRRHRDVELVRLATAAIRRSETSPTLSSTHRALRRPRRPPAPDNEPDPMSTAAPFESMKAVRFHHCDPAGIVFYPQYFVLMNELVEDWFNEGLGIELRPLPRRRAARKPRWRTSNAIFIAPSKVGDTLAFRLSVRKIGTSSLTLAVEARAGEETRVRATLVVVHASLDTRRAVPFAPEFRAMLARYAA
jgi:4-hydroxybenzoyl-CoA thioesterase